jgi:hypothetical protein
MTYLSTQKRLALGWVHEVGLGGTSALGVDLGSSGLGVARGVKSNSLLPPQPKDGRSVLRKTIGRYKTLFNLRRLRSRNNFIIAFKQVILPLSCLVETDFFFPTIINTFVGCLMEQQQKTLELVVMSAKKDRSSAMREEDKLDQDDQRNQVEQLDKLDDSTEGNSSIACGHWIHRIKPVISSLPKRANNY